MNITLDTKVGELIPEGNYCMDYFAFDCLFCQPAFRGNWRCIFKGFLRKKSNLIYKHPNCPKPPTEVK